jgi:hypothetical protein
MSRYDQAELLTALWKLGAGPEQLLPTSHGILDKALKETLEDLPSQLRDALTFRVSGVGLRSYELPDILLAAQEANLTSEPNYTYLTTVVKLDEDAARQIALLNGLSTAQARAMGHKIAAAVARIQESTQPSSALVVA